MNCQACKGPAAYIVRGKCHDCGYIQGSTADPTAIVTGVL